MRGLRAVGGFAADTCRRYSVHLGTVLNPALGCVGDDVDPLPLLDRPLQQPQRTVIETSKSGLVLCPDVDELQGREVGGAEDGVVPVEDED